MEIMIKSKTRVQNHGEVFTPKRIIEQMLDLSSVKTACQDLKATFLEPAAGEGAFLLEILKLKLEMVSGKYNDSLIQYENHALIALSTLYGIELLEDNAEVCAANLYQAFHGHYKKQVEFYRENLNQKILDQAQEIITLNIVHGDFLTRQTANGSDLIFYKWQIVNHTESIRLERTAYGLNQIYEAIEKEKAIPAWDLKSKSEAAEVDTMKFGVIIGNPPYHENNSGERDSRARKSAAALPLYDKFVLASMEISHIQSFIIPSRWAFGAGKGLRHFSEVMLNDQHIEAFIYYQDSQIVFPDNTIKGGIAYFARDIHHKGKAHLTMHLNNGHVIKRHDYLNTAQSGKLIVYTELGTILEKVTKSQQDFSSIMEITSTLKPYAIRTDFFRRPQKYGISRVFDEQEKDDDIRVLGLNIEQKRIYKYISRSETLTKGTDTVDTWKVFSPYAYGKGAFGELMPYPTIGQPGDIATETFLRFGNFDNQFEAESVAKYMKTKFFRALVSVLKVTQHSTKTYRFVPLQDFTRQSDIDWCQMIQEIDAQLYEKYSLNKVEIQFIEDNVAPSIE